MKLPKRLVHTRAAVIILVIATSFFPDLTQTKCWVALAFTLDGVIIA